MKMFVADKNLARSTSLNNVHAATLDLDLDAESFGGLGGLGGNSGGRSPGQVSKHRSRRGSRSGRVAHHQSLGELSVEQDRRNSASHFSGRARSGIHTTVDSGQSAVVDGAPASQHLLSPTHPQRRGASGRPRP